MDTNEEMIEEIEEIETEDTPSLEDVIQNEQDFTGQNIEPAIEVEPVLQEENIINQEGKNEDISVDEEPQSETSNNSYSSQVTDEELEAYERKRKMPIVIALSVLLVIDIAALVIYLIGIDKVLGFIK